MNRIQELRKKSALNQTELAKNIGVSQSTLSYWERGDYEPDNDSIIKIADFFDVTTDYLLGRTDNPSPPNAKPPIIEDPEALVRDLLALEGGSGKAGILFYGGDGLTVVDSSEELVQDLIKVHEMLQAREERSNPKKKNKRDK